MKRNYILLLLSLLMMAGTVSAQQFEQYFTDATLRLDYIFAGNSTEQAIYLDQMSQSPHWYGKRQRLAEVPLRGNGIISISDVATGKEIYRHSFSTLFQEWLATEEAKHVSRSFENVFQVPLPKQPVNVTVELRDYHDRPVATMTHTVRPDDILIRHIGQNPKPYVTLNTAADTTRCINVAFVAEGYTTMEMERYLEDCRTAVDALFSHEPFGTYRQAFNIIALLSPSADSGVSTPRKGDWRQTVIGSHFDTFYSERYLTTLHLKQLNDLLAGLPYEHIIVLANTDVYGGGGIYNSYTLTAARHAKFRPVVVHEFGHSFGGLADEYPYGDDDPMYFADTEPWEPNLTTQHNFAAKWQTLYVEGKAGLIEGGGYLSHGVWRAYDDCRMRTNEHPAFCLVCQQALERLIQFYVTD